MAYSDLPARVTGYLFLATDYTQIKDNFDASGVAVVTTLGDIPVASASKALGRLAVGTDGYVLQADSGETLGMLWANISAQEYARYEVAATKTATNAAYTIVQYDTQVDDDSSAVTTGAAWKYTAPSTGYYVVIASALLQSSANWDAGEQAGLWLYKNNAQYTALDNVRMQAAGTYAVFMNGAAGVSLSASDYVDVRVFSGSGSDETIDDTAELGHISIFKLF